MPQTPDAPTRVAIGGHPGKPGSDVSNGTPWGASSIGDTILRVSTSGIFIVSGLGHVLRPERVLPKMSHSPVAAWLEQVVAADTLVLLTGPPLLIGGLGLLLGWRTRAWAVLLLLLLVPITLGTHVGHLDGVGPLFKNIALLGALVKLALDGLRTPSDEASASPADARIR